MAQFGYAKSQATATRLLKRFRQGAIALSRTIPGTPDPDKPWEPVTDETRVYELDAVARGVAQKYVDGTVIIASDLQITVSVKAKHTLTDSAAADGATVDIDPQMTDTITIGGQERVPKRILPVPASGTPVAFIIFVGS